MKLAKLIMPLAAVLWMCLPPVAYAVNYKVNGLWDISFIYNDQTFQKDAPNDDPFKAIQRLRTQLQVISSESLKGVLQLEIGDLFYGQDGAALGSDGKNVEVRYSFIDWVVPQTDISVRMGLQSFSLPGYVATASDLPVPGYTRNSSAVLDADGAGVSLNIPINKYLSATPFWLRAFSDNNNKEDNTADFFGLVLPVKVDSARITPWAMYGAIGKNSLTISTMESVLADWGLLPPMVAGGFLAGKLTGDQTEAGAMWGGITADYSGATGLYAAMDFNIGRTDLGELAVPTSKAISLEREGWYLAGQVDYDLDVVTPGLLAWYASGDDSDPYNGSEMLPSVSPYWKGTPYSFGRNHYTYDHKIGLSPAGTMGAGVYLKDFFLTEKIQETGIRFTYLRGTNDSDMPKAARLAGFALTPSGIGDLKYMTDEDRAFEISLEGQYRLFPNLILYATANYINMDISKDVWGESIYSKHKPDGYECGINFRYIF